MSEFNEREWLTAESRRDGHVCGEFLRPCVHHGSMHCLSCCIREGRDREMRMVWTRQELLEAAIADPQERTMLRVAISPKVLLMLMDWQSERRGEECEVIMAYGDPQACELRFFYRDVDEEA